MVYLKQKFKLQRQERKLINKLQSITFYKYFIGTINFLFSPIKVFIVAGGKSIQKLGGIISVSTYKIFGKKIGYIDDFIVNKNNRGQGIGKKLMHGVLQKSKDNDHDYLTLVSKSHRKTSHHLYKKIGFTVISCGVFILAYKKIQKNKK